MRVTVCFLLSFRSSLVCYDENFTCIYVHNNTRTPLTNDGTLSVDNTLHTILTVHTSVVPVTSYVDHHHL